MRPSLPKGSRLPDFLVLGTQKGGTSTLHTLLKTHPNVFLPRCKEVHYFSLKADRPIQWYSNLYDNAKHSQRCGDITPFYLFHPDVPTRIHDLLPTAGLVVLLRDPVERCLSQIFHAHRLGFESLTPEEAIDAEEQRLESGDLIHIQEHSYQARSLYLEQLDRYEKLFPKEQILVLKSENLFNKSEQTWKQIINFLKLPWQPLPDKLPHANRGRGEADRVNPALRRRLKDKFADTAAGVRKRYGFGWDWA